MEYTCQELFQPHYGEVNVYQIGDTLIDTGHVCPKSRQALKEAVNNSLTDINNVVLTHPHIDHVGGTLCIDSITHLPHTVYEGADRILYRFNNEVKDAREEMAILSSGVNEDKPKPDREYFPTNINYATDRVNIDCVVTDGDIIQVGPYNCEVIHTPGHSHQHMSLHHEPSGVMISGDIVSTNGHFMYGPLHWDINEYKMGLRRIRDLEPDLLLTGHGEPIENPVEHISEALSKAERTEREIVEIVEEKGPITANELAVEALNATDENVQFLSTVASAYVIHLTEQNMLQMGYRPHVVALL